MIALLDFRWVGTQSLESTMPSFQKFENDSESIKCS